MRVLRVSSIPGPVDRSMIVSAPASMAARTFSSSSSMLLWSTEVPTLAFTLARSPLPMARGAMFRCFTFWVITVVPSASP
jgi:hypothetical protein